MRVFLTFSLAALLLAGCGNLQNLAAKARAKRQQKAMEKLTQTSSEEAAARLGEKAVGEVAYVDEAEQFILIRALTGVNLPPQSGLETRRGSQRTALLRTTPEKKNGFIAADLVEGTPQTGDGVFPSTAKPRPKPPRRPGTTPARTATDAPPPAPLPTGARDPSAPADLPSDFTPVASPEDDLHPANLPPLPDPIRTPEDLKRLRQ